MDLLYAYCDQIGEYLKDVAPYIGYAVGAFVVVVALLISGAIFWNRDAVSFARQVARLEARRTVARVSADGSSYPRASVYSMARPTSIGYQDIERMSRRQTTGLPSNGIQMRKISELESE